MSMRTTSSAPKDDASASFSPNVCTAHCSSATADDFSNSWFICVTSNGTEMLHALEDDATAAHVLLVDDHEAARFGNPVERVERDRLFRGNDELGHFILRDFVGVLSYFLQRRGVDHFRNR